MALLILRTPYSDSMDEALSTYNYSALPLEVSREPMPSDPSANPFRLVVDPVMRMRLRKALADLIDSHDAELARYVFFNLPALS